MHVLGILARSGVAWQLRPGLMSRRWTVKLTTAVFGRPALDPG